MSTKRLKPADNAASKLPSVVMRVLSVSTKVEYISSRESVLVATFLHENGFVGITAANGQTTAIAPKPEREGDPIIVVECGLGADGKLSNMNMVRRDRETSRLIDSGHVRFEYQNDGKGSRGFWAGGENIPDWDITAIEDDSVKVMMMKPALSLQPVLASESISAGTVRKPAQIYEPAWKTKPRIQEFIRDACGGDGRMATVAKAMDAIPMLEGTNRVKKLCEMFGDNHINISILLLANRLHSDLQPLLDRPIGDKKRMPVNVLRTLIYFPKDKQVWAWNEAKDKPSTAAALAVLKELLARIS